AALALCLATACGPSHTTTDATGGGDDGGPPCDDGGGPTVDAAPCGDLIAHLRDFRADQPDFEDALGDDRGLVQAQLGVDGKPVYAPGGPTPTGSGQAR